MSKRFTVTRVAPSNKLPGKYSVFVDGEFLMSINQDLILQFGISEGKSYSEDEFLNLKTSLFERKLRDTAFRILSARSHSRRELETKLLRRGFDRRSIRLLTESFLRDNLLSDRQFAEDWVESRMRQRPRARRLLVVELVSKGVDRDLAETVVNDKLEGTDDSRTAFALLTSRPEKFLRDNSVDTKRKICNYLRYRGFDTETIISVSERFLKEFGRENEQS